MPREVQGATESGAVRRKDREITDNSFIRSLLKTSPYGALATAAEAQPNINIVTYCYDESENAIFFHTSPYGTVADCLRNNPSVCFNVCTMGRLLPADRAVKFSVEYKSVSVRGEVELLKNDTLARQALELLMIKYFPHHQPGKDYIDIQPEDLARTAVYRLNIQSWTAKCNQKEPDYPGAFYFPAEK